MPRETNPPQYAENWMPESRYYGDRFPRTMEEAFGHGARLDDIERRHWLDQHIGYACVIFAVLALAGVIAGWL